jgi:hypothetical protein
VHLAVAILAGVISAALFAAVAMGSFLGMTLTFFTTLPLLAIGMTHGTLGSLIAGVAGAVAVAVAGDPVFAIPYVLGAALPAGILARQAMLHRAGTGGAVEWYPLGNLAAWLGGLGIALTFGWYLALTWQQGASGIEAIAAALRETYQAVRTPGTQDLPPETFTALALAVPGVAGASWALMVAINGALAQAALVRAGRATRPATALADLTLPRLAVLVPLAGVVLWSLASGLPQVVGASVALVGCAVVLLQGLAVVHAFVRAKPWRLFFLVGFYIGLVVLSQVIVPALLLVGVVEPWLGVRQRLGVAAGSGTGKEE